MIPSASKGRDPTTNLFLVLDPETPPSSIYVYIYIYDMVIFPRHDSNLPMVDKKDRRAGNSNVKDRGLDTFRGVKIANDGFLPNFVHVSVPFPRVA